MTEQGQVLTTIMMRVPEENLLSISSYLSIQDILSLASTCRSIRTILFASQGATKDIWTSRIQDVFPAVFVSYPSSPLTSKLITIETAQPPYTKPAVGCMDVTFVDVYHLSVCGLSDICSDDINLPLLTSLMPSRYPQSIDQNTLHSKLGHNLFRSYYLPLEAFNQGQDCQDSDFDEDKNTSGTIPVVQFVGKVGTGNRCIRSNQPFPPSCRKIKTSLGDAMKMRSKEASRFFSRISLKANRTANTIAATQRAPEEPLPCKQSPIFQFLSSFDNNCNNSPSSQLGKNDANRNLDSNTNIGVNAPESVTTNNVKIKKGRMKRFGKLCYHNKSHDNLRPFVIPTIISRTRSNDCINEQSLVVDVTPRLVAYFEVTIMKQEQGSCSLSESSKKYHDENQRHECVAIGLSMEPFQTQEKMPGWDNKSFGYHGDNGGFYHGVYAAPRRSGTIRSGPTFGPGDTVGCGLEYSTRRIFFTKNGKLLDCCAFNNLARDTVDKGLFPTVGVDTEFPIFMNFGEHPFKFDLISF